MKPLILLVCCITCVFALSVSAGVRINGIGITYPTIQDAVNAAVNNDRLHVSTGLYLENVAITNKTLTIEGGYLLDYISSLNDPDLTVIDGSSIVNSTMRLLSNATVTLQTLSVTGGSGFVLGGGISVNSLCALFTENTVVEQNSGFVGGGVGIASQASFTVYSNTYLVNNIALIGGGLATIGSNAVVTLGPFSDCVGNTAILGGGVAMTGGTYIQQSFTRIFGNLASSAGGGIYMANGSSATISGPEAYIGGPTFFVNQVTNGNGGGTFSANTGTVYEGLNCTRDEFDRVAKMRVDGVSISAIVRITGRSRETIRPWLERAAVFAGRFNDEHLQS